MFDRKWKVCMKDSLFLMVMGTIPTTVTTTTGIRNLTATRTPGRSLATPAESLTEEIVHTLIANIHIYAPYVEELILQHNAKSQT